MSLNVAAYGSVGENILDSSKPALEVEDKDQAANFAFSSKKLSGKTQEIQHREDRLGANISSYICQIIFGDQNGHFIKQIDSSQIASNRTFANSIYIKSLNNLIDDININRKETPEEVIEFEPSFRKLNSRCCIQIKQDIHSYFIQHYFKRMQTYIKNNAGLQGYKIPYKWKKIICVHLRLDDVSERSCYDGRYSFNYHKNKINKNSVDFSDKYDHYRKLKLSGFHKKYDRQAPMSNERIQKVIDVCKKKYPKHKVMVVASPIGGDITLKHDFCIRTNDESFDLYCMMHSNVLICSKSTYSLVAAHFHKGSKIFAPKWGLFASTGMESKYDKSNLKYFY
ncbi:hypothetical protein AB751O23_AA_00070 [Chlamydiales bacterium SCGC AB-751-O23]|nr:hypothetical protein AB751O23_AA_00070 [Chlamydiales bacterium SCGC AB-751-O23]